MAMAMAMAIAKIYTDEQLDELSYSPEYAEFIMSNGSNERSICDGDMLTIAMEDGYLFDEFLKSLED